MIKLISCEVNGKEGEGIERVVIIMSYEEKEYMIRAMTKDNKGLLEIEDIEADGYILDKLDLIEMITLPAGKYDVINWKLIPTSSLYDIERLIIHEEIPISEIGIDIKTIHIGSLQVDNNIAYLDDKKYYLKYVNRKPKELFIKEVQVLNKLKHPNIIEIEALVVNDDGNVLGMITPLANRGTLEDNKNSDLKLLWLSQIKDAMKYTKSIGIEYTDIKPSNVVIHDNNAILIDFDGGTTRGWDMKKFEEYIRNF